MKESSTTEKLEGYMVTLYWVIHTKINSYSYQKRINIKATALLDDDFKQQLTDN